MSFPEILSQIPASVYNQGLKILLILVTTFILSKVSSKLIEQAVCRLIRSGPNLSHEAEKKREDTLIQTFKGTIKSLLWVFAILISLSEAGVDIGPLIAGAGIVGIAVGFGGQYLIRDWISGLFIIMENQYRVGDIVEIAGKIGLVEEISLRMTRMRDLDGIVYHVPHGEVTTVSNYSKGLSKVNMNIGVAYRSNLDQVIEVVNAVGLAVAADPKFSPLIIEAPAFMRVDKLGDSSIEVKIVGTTYPGKQWDVAGELRKRLKEAFDEHGIEIPFPQMVVHKG